MKQNLLQPMLILHLQRQILPPNSAMKLDQARIVQNLFPDACFQECTEVALQFIISECVNTNVPK
jgi:hypothetical protein